MVNPVREDVLPGADDDGPALSRLLQVGEGDAVLYGRLGDLDPVLDVIDQVADLLVESIALLIRSMIIAAVTAMITVMRSVIVIVLVVSVGLVVVVVVVLAAAGAEVALHQNLRGLKLPVVREQGAIVRVV